MKKCLTTRRSVYKGSLSVLVCRNQLQRLEYDPRRAVISLECDVNIRDFHLDVFYDATGQPCGE